MFASRHHPCGCAGHQEIYRDLPSHDVVLIITDCMRTCPYCGSTSPTASKLRRHLRAYAKNNVQVEAARNGPSAKSGGADAGWYDVSKAQVSTAIKSRADSTPDQILPHDIDKTTENANKDRSDENSSKTFKAMLPAMKADASSNDLVDFLKLEPEAFDKELLETLEFSDLTSLSTFEEKDDARHKLWEESTKFWPRKIPAASCWGSDPPTRDEELWSEICERKDASVYLDGHITNPNLWSKVLFNAAYPSTSASKLIILNHIPKGDRFKSAFKVPYDGLPFTIAQKYDAMYNLTPLYSFVDLHIDNGLESLSVTLGACVKLWLLYPPTIQNLRLYCPKRNEKDKLKTLAPQLEGGIILLADSSEALFFPAGTLHAVFTVQGNFLVGNQFIHKDTITAFTNYAVAQYGYMDDNDEAPEFYLTMLEAALSGDRQLEALESWSRLTKLEITIRWGSKKRWSAETLAMWSRVFNFASFKAEFLKASGPTEEMLQRLDSLKPELTFLSTSKKRKTNSTLHHQ